MKPQLLALITAAAWGIGGEQLTGKGLVGMLMTMGGIILLSL